MATPIAPAIIGPPRGSTELDMIDRILNFCAAIYPPILGVIIFFLIMIFAAIAPNVFGGLLIITAFLAVVLGMLRAHHII